MNDIVKAIMATIGTLAGAALALWMVTALVAVGAWVVGGVAAVAVEAAPIAMCVAGVAVASAYQGY